MSRKITVKLTQQVTKEVTVTIPAVVSNDKEFAIEQAIDRLPVEVEADGEWQVKSVRRH